MLPMSIPRLVLTPELMGKTLGRLNDTAKQMHYMNAGIELLQDANQGDSWIEIGD
jgi:hypothetical protein